MSDIGQVRSLFRYKKTLKPNLMNNGYLSVELFKNKKSKRILVHRLVAQAFIPNPDNLPCVNHKDESRTNNAVENLEWCTYKYNSNYGNCQKKKAAAIDYNNPVFMKNIKKAQEACYKPIIQLSKSGVFIARYDSIKQASKASDTDAGHICDVAKGKRKSAGGYKWQYERSVDLSQSEF